MEKDLIEELKERAKKTLEKGDEDRNNTKNPNDWKNGFGSGIVFAMDEILKTIEMLEKLQELRNGTNTD